MKTKLVTTISIASIMVVLMISAFMAIPVKAQQAGPAIDIVRLKTVKSPDAELIAMQTETTDFLPDMIRTGDIEKLDGDGFTISSAPGFHMGHIGTNMRADQSYRTDRPAGELPYLAAVLSDVAFRHAVLHAYDQDGILASIYKYIVTKSTSLVPPAQGGWLSTTMPQHPYNPGDPFTSTASDHDSCGVLKAAGYTFVDTGTIGTVDGGDYWEKSGFSGAIPTISLFTPTYEVAPTSAEHGARLITSLNSIGLNNMVHVPHEFSPYITKVYQNAEFDMYMIFWSLGRFPDHLYDMLHSSQDCATFPWRYNAPGVDDAYVDARVETLKFGLNHAAKMAAAHEVQDWLYNVAANSQALPYIQLYSRVMFVASNPDLRGVVNSPGYGADNGWTWLNWQWAAGQERIEGGKTVVIYSNGEEPERLNPTYASTVYAWNVISPTGDGLIAVNPYTHEDLPWLADSWTVTPTATGMDIVFNLNSTVTWHDGNAYTAEDAEFSMEFLRDWQIPRYTSSWQNIVDVVVDVSGAGGTITVELDETSQFLLYDVAGIAALLPQPVWNLGAAPAYGWASQTAVLGYDPAGTSATPTGARSGTMTKYGAADGAQNHLYGTGPYVFQFYDAVGQYADLWANRNYFKDTAEIARDLTEMFHAVGDVDRDGTNGVIDLSRMGLSFGYFSFEPEYDPDADVNTDNVVDTRDISVLSAHWGDKKQYP